MPTSLSAGIFPPQIYPNTSLPTNHFRHLEEFIGNPSGLFSLLSIRSFFKLFRCRLSGPRKIDSIDTLELYVRASCRKSTSKLFGAKVSLRKAISEGDTVLVWIFFSLSGYSKSALETPEDALLPFLGVELGVRRSSGYVGERAVGAKAFRSVFQSCSLFWQFKSVSDVNLVQSTAFCNTGTQRGTRSSSRVSRRSRCERVGC